MSYRKLLGSVIGLTLVILLIVGCGGAPAATPAAEAPAATPTPVPPTTAPTLGFKDRSQCPSLDTGVSVPERLPNVQWSAMDNPSDAWIWAVEALSATDVWAVDLKGAILHYDGTAWKIVDTPVSDSQLRGLAMLSPNEGWAVGYGVFPPYPSFILHYANQRWSVASEPEINGLWEVDFVTPNEGWAVGYGILRYNGKEWVPFSSPEELNIPPEKGIAEEHGSLCGVDMVSADEGWAVGDSGTILHYQGDAWKHIDSPVEAEFNDVLMLSPRDGWIVGGNGTLLHFDGSAWSIVNSPTQDYLRAITVDNEGTIWVVGNNTLLRFDGKAWAEVEVEAHGGKLLSVDVSKDGAVWLVGKDGLILRRELLDTNVPIPAPPLLKAIDNSDGDGSFKVSWESVPGNVGYILQEADKSMCPVTIYFGSDTSKEVSRKDVGTYYYRVSALGFSGQSEWSEIKSVEVTVPPPPCSVDCSEGVTITCESGPASYESSCWNEMSDEKGLLRRCEVKAKFEQSGNEYRFDVTSYTAQTSDGKIQERSEVTVTGGVFGDEPQYCQNY